MRNEILRHIFWLLIIVSWVFGVIYARWSNLPQEFFVEMSQAVRVPNPFYFENWWDPMLYFTLTVVAVFVLSQIFFGAGGAVFLFSRGVYDNSLIIEIEKSVKSWVFPDIYINEIFSVLLVCFVLLINLPLCMWAAHLGFQRSIYLWHRLRGEPTKPETGLNPLSQLLLLIAISLMTGLIVALILPYAQVS
jgi:hypothetical protein